MPKVNINLQIFPLIITLFLDDAQQKKLEKTAAQLTVSPLNQNAPREMFDKLIEQINVNTNRLLNYRIRTNNMFSQLYDLLQTLGVK